MNSSENPCFDCWDETRKVEQIILHYPWSAFGVSIREAYEAWRECLQMARQEQLQAFGIESLGPWEADSTTNYEFAMQMRIEDAKRRYLNQYIWHKLPLEAFQGFKAKFGTQK